MNTAHLHLIFNHAPIFATLFALTLIALALVLRRNPGANEPGLIPIESPKTSSRQQLLHVGLWTLVAGAALALPAFLTGEPAEEAIEHAAGVAESTIEAHESIAKFALAFSGFIGLGALGALIRMRRAMLTQSVALAFFTLAAVSTAVFGYTAYQGGQIRHPEIASTESFAPATQHSHPDHAGPGQPDSCCQAKAKTTTPGDEDRD